MIFSSSSLVLLWYLSSSAGWNSLARSRGTWIVISPAEVRKLRGRLPLRELPELRPVAAYGS